MTLRLVNDPYIYSTDDADDVPQVNLIPFRWTMTTGSCQGTEFYIVLVTMMTDNNLFLVSCHIYFKKW